MIKICYASQSFYPYAGGVSDYILDLGKKLVEKGYEIHEVTLSTPETLKYEIIDGMHINRFYRRGSESIIGEYGIFKENILKVCHGNKVSNDVLSRREHFGYRKYLKVNEEAKKEIKLLNNEEKFDIIHIHDFQFLPLGGMLRDEGIKCPLVYTWHIPFLKSMPQIWKEFFVEYIKDYDCCIFSTDEYVEAAVDAGLEKEKVIKIMPFVDSKRFTSGDGKTFREKYKLNWIDDAMIMAPEERRKDAISWVYSALYGQKPAESPFIEGPPIILCVSRMDPRKGHMTLLEAMPYVLEEFPYVKLVFVGNGSMTNKIIKSRSGYRERLERLVKNKNLAHNVIFTGHITEEELKNAFAASYVVVQPSLMEGFGLTVTEGMMFDKPVIGSRVGGIKHQIADGENGYLFEPRDSAELADGILDMLRNPEKAKQFGRKGKERGLQLFDVKRGLKDHLALYKRILAKKDEKS